MHGLGNDFIVVDNTRGEWQFDTKTIRSLADRRFGIGFDQLLICESASTDDVEFDYRIFNADGLEVEHCGNGARCFARFVRDQQLTNSTVIPVNTSAGRIELVVLEDGQVKVMMGTPEFEVSKIPLVLDTTNAAGSSGVIPVENTHKDRGHSQGKVYRLALPLEEAPINGLDADKILNFDAATSSVLVGAVSMGNPHVILLVDDIDTAPVKQLGAWLQTHPAFPARVNVGFLQVINRHEARLRVYERGVGETLACGTGACAAAAFGICYGLFERKVQITLTGGPLAIYWPDVADDIEMTGPCTTVFEGLIEM